ncbi:MAG TPA: deoxyribodipyrimidine photo-lyase [Tepidisphaeraceae bacterium]|nr:deoxyribodipyrimidine photo-lyase [Tepidisphaeraceae bacterium]
MIHESRIHFLNDLGIDKSRRFVLYWMQVSMRTRYNFALEHAIAQANELALPLIVCFGLMDDYPEANERHYAFLLAGLNDVARNLKARGLKLIVKHGSPPDAALHFGIDAALIVCDRGYLRHQRVWRDQVADEAKVRVVQIESDVVVPVDVVSDHHEFAARTIRPKITKQLDEFLVPIRHFKPKHESIRLKIEGDIDPTDPIGNLKKLKLDRSVRPSERFKGGEDEAQKLLKKFIARFLKGYAEARNEPADAATSHLSPYLHFGHISPVEIAIAVRGATNIPSEDRDSYLEELIVRRELSMNFCEFVPNYDQYDCLPDWSKKTLEKHSKDAREITYTLQQLESADTHDRYWNAAQREMTQTGFMHNYMRMYWGKKIIEWTIDPKEAFKFALHLNNKYELDGRDPNSFANIAWLFGTHDRPWGERKIFGTVRYMNDKGLERKFDMEAYVKWVDSLE